MEKRPTGCILLALLGPGFGEGLAWEASADYSDISFFDFEFFFKSFGDFVGFDLCAVVLWIAPCE